MSLTDRRHVLLRICVLACCLVGQTRLFAEDATPAIVRNPNEQFLKIRATDSADELWARALWLTIPNNKASSDEVESLFMAAIVRAKTKAPIYVSFGDAASGASVVLEMFNHITKTVTKAAEADLSAATEKLSQKPDLPKAEAAATLEQVFQDSFKNALTKGPGRSEFEALSKVLQGGSAASAMYYLAAVAEDPKYPPAWFRLATLSEGKAKERALAEFARLDPDNSIPDYIHAAIAVKVKDFPAALKSVQRGNARKLCRVYKSPRPKDFLLVYPDNELSREFSAVGKPLRPAGLDFLVGLVEAKMEWADPVASYLSYLRFRLTDEGMRLQKEGQTASAVHYFEAVHDMGFQLMPAYPRDFSLMLAGIGCAGGCRDELRAVYKSLGDEAKGKRLEELETKRVRLRTEMRKVLDACRKMSPEEIQGNVNGTRVQRDDIERDLTEALINAGLEHAADAKPR